ncbi:MAG TPA: hypothetical protein VGR28_02915, partial [Candidatus Thermoplasmatota archaeon]|nr:hypothetical protein [Candidatus Thermoplasmatota archaeon]
MRSKIAWVLAAVVALPSVATASHMGLYVNDPLQHDLSGQVPEPDGLATSVLGPTLQNCVVAVLSAPGESAACGQAFAGTVAAGCTGLENGAPVRRLDGQCGLWTVGAPRPNGLSVPIVTPALGPGKIPAPISEPGTGVAGPRLRFLDGRLDGEFAQNPGGAGGTQVIDYNQLLAGLAAGMGPVPALTPLAPFASAVLPGDRDVWAWYGEWQDLNGNGVVDACYAACRGTTNEFVWLGSCPEYYGPRSVEAIEAGVCAEDPNPNATPPGTACGLSDVEELCAQTEITFWIWPGEHGGPGLLQDAPGVDAVEFVEQLVVGGDPCVPEHGYS